MKFLKLTKVIIDYSYQTIYSQPAIVNPSLHTTITSTGSHSATIPSGFFQTIGSKLGLQNQQQAQNVQSQQAAAQQNASGQNYQGFVGTIQNYTPPSPPKPVYTKTEVLLPIDSISYLEEYKTNGNNTLIMLKQNHSVYVEETIDQIQKQIHTVGFNDKMDNLLK